MVNSAGIRPRNDFEWPASTALSQEALAQAFATEPAWIDLRPVTHADGAGRRRRFRWLTPSLADPRLQDATASLIAEVKHVPKDALIGEHLRRSRQTRRAVTSALSTLTILLIAAVVAAFLAVRQAHARRTRRLSPKRGSWPRSRRR